MTQPAERLSARIEHLPAGSLRRRVLEGARRFKTSWVELGQLLSEVKREGTWREWGYPSFERYCAQELFLRRTTAEKLTASYAFLERHEPELARPKGQAQAAPPFELIEVLSRAEAAGRLPVAEYREMRDEILERSPSPAAVSRRLAERYGPLPRPEPPGREQRLRRLVDLAERFARACRADSELPGEFAERAISLARDIAALLDD